MSAASSSPNPRVIVATTVALSFISFWRGASIVLSDLASSAFYAGGAAEEALGQSAPWFVLAVMLFSFAVRSAHVESCSMYVRGGVYIVVRDSMGPAWAKLSVSALVFDYILTGPISGVSAGQYIGHLINELGEVTHTGWHINVNYFSVAFAVAVTLYFWWQNTKGVHESSGKALRIMQITTVMVVVLIIWCVITVIHKGLWNNLPPAPLPSNLKFDPHAQGWLAGTFWLEIPAVAIIAAFGHSLLSMSGFETLAQVYREIASPKMKNLRIAAQIVCVYALICTGGITLFASMIIPAAERPQHYSNLIAGLAMNLSGPYILRLACHVFVVFVGGLILSGALNTSIIGAHSILSRLAEDGVLLPWFRQPHKRFGTPHRIINSTVALQLATILLSQGDMIILAQAYAFGVVWSFFFKSLGVTVLRFQRTDQEYKTPLNFHVKGKEIPVGLILITLVLGLVAIANLFTKPLATQYGIAFTVAVFVVFAISEKIYHRREQTERKGLEQFALDHQAEISSEQLHSRPGCVLVAVREYHRLEHLRRVLQKTNLRRHDIVVMTVHAVQGAGEFDLDTPQLFSAYEKELFSNVVSLAEKEGKKVSLLVVPGIDPFSAIVQTANRLRASRVVTGVSERMDSSELARRIGLAWEALPPPRHSFSLEIISPGRESIYVNLGPHPPRLWPEDVDLVHDIWLEASAKPQIGSRLHHRDVVGLALRRLKQDMDKEGPAILEEFAKEVRKPPPDSR